MDTKNEETFQPDPLFNPTGVSTWRFGPGLVQYLKVVEGTQFILNQCLSALCDLISFFRLAVLLQKLQMWFALLCLAASNENVKEKKPNQTPIVNCINVCINAKSETFTPCNTVVLRNKLNI